MSTEANTTESTKVTAKANAKTNEWPARLRFEASAQRLVVSWGDDTESIVSYRKLRAASPSAQNNFTNASEVDEGLGVKKAEHVGRYAVRIHFSDGHSTGLYRWGLLKSLGQDDS